MRIVGIVIDHRRRLCKKNVENLDKIMVCHVTKFKILISQNVSIFFTKMVSKCASIHENLATRISETCFSVTLHTMDKTAPGLHGTGKTINSRSERNEVC